MRTAIPPRRARTTNAAILGILLWASALPAKDGDPPAAAAPLAALPGDDLRLIVLVVIDQFRGDSLDRYERLFGPGGFRRLMEGGVWYQDASYEHAHTVTGPGNATIATGAHPAVHGIVGDDWIDRQTGRTVGCVADATSPLVGVEATAGNASPSQLISTTFADEWVFATAGRARAFGVSLKDRAAILPVGRTAKAFWYHGPTGRMVSSRYYFSDLPPWVKEWNGPAPADRYAGKRWERATRDDDGVPSAVDDRSFEGALSGIGRTFPHRLAAASRGRGPGQPAPGGPGAGKSASDGRVAASPAGAGKAAPEGGSSPTDSGGGGDGAGGRADGSSDSRGEASAVNDPERSATADDSSRDGGAARGTGFGRTGAFGRGFGLGARASEQMQYTPFGDEMVLDFSFKLIRAEELGRKNALDVLAIGLSANDFVGHSFGPDSVEAKELAYHLDRRMADLLRFLDETIGTDRYLLVLTSDHGVAYPPESVSEEGFAAKRFSYTEMAKRIRRRVSIRFRYLEWDAGFAASGFYFEPEARLGGGVEPELLEKTAAEVIRATTGIASAYTRSDILAGRLPDTDLARRVRAAYHAERSPDVFLIPEPYWIPGTTAASHGTPHTYDAHVPLIIYGGGLKPARIRRAVSMTSLAPTLTAILGCSAPSGSREKPLLEVLDGAQRKPYRK